MEVPTLSGSAKIKIPPGTQNGRVFKLRERGMPVLNSSVRGDLMVRVVVEVREHQRLQFVHVNTVRYRLRQVEAATGLDPALPEDALTLRLALMLGRRDALL